MHTSHDVTCVRRWLYMCVFCRAWSLVAWLFKFCCSFICDPACAVVLRMSSAKQKRCVLSIQQKLEICDRSRNGWSYSQISAEYGIGKLTVFDIKSEDKLKTFQSQLQNEDCTKERCIVRTADFPDNKAVFLWSFREDPPFSRRFPSAIEMWLPCHVHDKKQSHCMYTRTV